jgi:uncharacterized protein YciI
MDQFAAGMIARGPTFTDDESATGSVHILDLSDPAAARAFAFEEPNYRAGVYRDVMLRRWRNLLGRTMWEFPGGREGAHRYLVIGLGAGPGLSADLEVPMPQDELIAYGPLLADDGVAWLGTAAIICSADPAGARAVLTADRYAGSRYTTGTSAGGLNERRSRLGKTHDRPSELGDRRQAAGADHDTALNRLIMAATLPLLPLLVRRPSLEGQIRDCAPCS